MELTAFTQTQLQLLWITVSFHSAGMEQVFLIYRETIINIRQMFKQGLIFFPRGKTRWKMTLFICVWVRKKFNCQFVILRDSPSLSLAAYNTGSHLNSASNKHYPVVNNKNRYTEETTWVLPMKSFKMTDTSTDQTTGQKFLKFYLPTSTHHVFEVRRRYFFTISIPLLTERKILWHYLSQNLVV